MPKQSLRKRVFGVVKNDPTLPLKSVVKQFPGESYGNIKTYRAQCLRDIKSNITKTRKKKSTKNSTPQGGSSNGVTPTISINEFNKLSWKQKLEGAIFGMYKLDTTALTLYDKLGYLKEDEQKEESRKFIFKEPEWFVPHQSALYNAFLKGNCCVIGMRQLTYKTTTGLCAAANKLYEQDKSLMVQISTGMDLSKELLSKIDHDERVASVWDPVLKTSNKESKILHNNSRLICRPCKPTSLQGLTGGLWIDELDKIIKEKQTRQALASALPIVITHLMNESAYIWISCNQASDEGALQFEYFINVLKQFGNYFPIYRVEDFNGIFQLIQINDFDIDIPSDPILRKDFFKDMMYKLLEALYDKAFARAQILNLYDDSAGMFRAEDVAAAFEGWSEKNLPKLSYKTVMAIDPGHTHATGVIILQKDKFGNLHEVFAKEYFGKSISEDAFKDEIYDLYVKWGVDEMYVESNSGGKWWRDHWIDRGLNCQMSNFGNTNPQTGEVSNMKRAFERAWYERVLKDFLEKRKIFLHSSDLLREFSLYNPVENKEKGKGDLVDALLHCCFHAAGGIIYLMELLEEKESLKEKDVGGILI